MTCYKINYLSHHGILGQKWGQRNGPPYPLGSGDHSAREKKADWRKSLNKKSNRLKENKEPKNNKWTRMSDKYYSDYIKKGIPESEARTLANKKVKIDKVLLATAGVTLAAMATYGAYKYYQLNGKTFIESGKLLQRFDTTKNLNDIFYASFGNHDNKVYEGYLPRHYLDSQGKWQTYKIFLEAVKDIKAPSKKESIEVFKQFMLNDKNASNIEGGKFARAIKNSANPSRTAKRLYDEFNQNLVLYNRGTDISGFYDRLKNLGYNAIADRNDQSYSGLMAHRPLIVFDKGSVTVKNTVSKLYDDSEYLSELRKISREQAVDTLMKDKRIAGSATFIGASIIANYGINEHKNKKKEGK